MEQATFGPTTDGIDSFHNGINENTEDITATDANDDLLLEQSFTSWIQDQQGQHFTTKMTSHCKYYHCRLNMRDKNCLLQLGTLTSPCKEHNRYWSYAFTNLDVKLIVMIKTITTLEQREKKMLSIDGQFCTIVDAPIAHYTPKVQFNNGRYAFVFCVLLVLTLNHTFYHSCIHIFIIPKILTNFFLPFCLLF